MSRCFFTHSPEGVKGGKSVLKCHWMTFSRLHKFCALSPFTKFCGLGQVLLLPPLLLRLAKKRGAKGKWVSSTSEEKK